MVEYSQWKGDLVLMHSQRKMLGEMLMQYAELFMKALKISLTKRIGLNRLIRTGGRGW